MTRVGVLFERTPEGVWVGSCSSVAGAFAQGATLAQCRRNLRGAIASLLEFAPAGDLEDLRDAEAMAARAELIDIPIHEPEAEELLTQAGIARIARVTRQAVHRWVQRSDFPRPVMGSATAHAWRKGDVLHWLASGRRTAGRPPARTTWPPRPM